VADHVGVPALLCLLFPLAGALLLALWPLPKRAQGAVGAGSVLLAFAAAVAAWFVPMALTQPGGVSAWVRATHLETLGAIRATSILDHASGGATNLGTVAAFTTVALAPVAALALVSACALGVRALARTARRATVDQPPTDTRVHSPGAAGAAAVAGGATWGRPWYQSRTAVLTAAIVPPLAIVTFVEFAKGGYLLAYLPGAVIALLLVPAALVGSPSAGVGRTDGRSPRSVTARATLVVVTLAVAAIGVVGAQRFLAGAGVLPSTVSASVPGLWVTQARYQAPYPDTRAAIRSADALDVGLAALGPLVRSGRDVVVIDSIDGGANFYRNAGWALPLHRVTLVEPGVAIYNEHLGSLYYTSSPTIQVGPGGAAYLIAPPSLPGLAQLTAQGRAVQVPLARPIGDYLVWRVSPGARVLGVRVVVEPGPRPLGSGLDG